MAFTVEDKNFIKLLKRDERL